MVPLCTPAFFNYFENNNLEGFYLVGCFNQIVQTNEFSKARNCKL